MFRNNFLFFLEPQYPFLGYLFGTVEIFRYLFRPCKVLQFIECAENVPTCELFLISVFHLYLQCVVSLLFLTVVLA